MTTAEFAPQVGEKQSGVLERLKQLARFVFCQVLHDPKPYESDHFKPEKFPTDNVEQS